MSIIVNDSFTGANTNPIGGIYTTVSGASWNNIQIVSHLAEGTVANNNNAVVDTTNTYANDQYAQITIGSPVNANQFYLLILRCTNPTNGSFNFVNWGFGQANTGANPALQFIPATGQIPLGLSATSPQIGDVYRFSVTGQLYSVYKNGILLGTYFDPSGNCTSGQPGFGFFCDAGGGADGTISNFTTGNSGTGVAWVV